MSVRSLSAAGESFSLVFALLVGLIALFPFAETAAGRWAIAVLVAVTFFFVFRSARLFRTHPVVSILVTLAILIVAVSAAGTTNVSGTVDRDVLGVYSVIVAGVLAIAIVVNTRRVFACRVVSADTILGAVAIYLFLGLAFGYAYVAVDDFTNGGLFAAGHVPSRGDHLYFSFITLTTLGYGDLAPVAPAGRSLSMVEAVLGQMVLITLVAWLVGRFRRNGGATRAPDESGEA